MFQSLLQSLLGIAADDGDLPGLCVHTGWRKTGCIQNLVDGFGFNRFVIKARAEWRCLMASMMFMSEPGSGLS